MPWWRRIGLESTRDESGVEKTVVMERAELGILWLGRGGICIEVISRLKGRAEVDI